MAEVKCREKNCDGVVEQGICTVCGARFSVHDLADDFDETERQAIVESVRQLLEPRDVAPNSQCSERQKKRGRYLKLVLR